jgi:hypothetical protein
VHHSTPARARRPSDAMRVKTLRSRMRQIKRTVGGDPWRDGLSIRPGRHGCSFGYGSRAFWHDDGYSVGRCVSRNPSSSHARWRFSRSPCIAKERHTTLATPSTKRQDAKVQDYGCSRPNPILACPVFGVGVHLLACALLTLVTCPHRVDKRVDNAGRTGRRCW